MIYVLARLLLMFAVTAAYASLAGLVLVTWPAGIFIAIAFVFLLSKRRAPRRLTSHGSARWMTTGEAERHGLYDDDGLILGYHIPLE